MPLSSRFLAAQEGESRQLMIVLHGLGDSGAGFNWLPAALKLPSLHYLFADAPDPYFTGYSWYDFSGQERPGIERSRQLLMELLDEYEQKGFPTNQTILFGFSQGCLMTMDVGLRSSRVLAGLIGISGYIFEPETLIGELSPVALQQRVLFTHGTQDPVIPYEAVREQVNQLKAAGLQIEWREFVKAHAIAGEEEINVMRRFILECYGTAPS